MSRRLFYLLPPLRYAPAFWSCNRFFSSRVSKICYPPNSCDLGVAARRIVLHKESTLPSRCNCIPMRCVYDTYCIHESFRFFVYLYSPSKSLSVNCCVKSSPPVRGSLGASSSPLEEFMFQGLQSKERERGN